MTYHKLSPQPLSATSAQEFEPLLTIKDVQRILRLSKPKVYELMHARGLPSLKIDGVRRFERVKLQAWIEQQYNVSP